MPSFQTMCALRIYMKRGDNAPQASLWKRLFRRPLATHVLQAALKAGVTHASLNLGNMGFSKGAKVVAMDVTELPVSALPVCLELVGAKPILEQFVRDNLKILADSTLVMLEGVHVVPQVVEGDLPPGAHRVEYVRADGLEVPVDHVAVVDDASKSAETSTRR